MKIEATASEYLYILDFKDIQIDNQLYNSSNPVILLCSIFGDSESAVQIQLMQYLNNSKYVDRF